MKTKNLLLLSIPVAFLLLLNGCASVTLLSTQPLDRLDTGGGTYNLILYGGQNARDFRSVAILDRTGDPYTILPYGAAFNYRIIENLPAAEAVERGERFINDLVSYRSTEKRVIHGPDHSVIGYELRPLFMPLDTGFLGDILDTSYVLQAENRVTVYVGFKGHYQDQRDFSVDSFPWGH